MITLAMIASLTLAGADAAPVAARTQPPARDKPAQPGDAPPPAQPGKSLDELLGLPSAPAPKQPKPAPTDQRPPASGDGAASPQLQRALAGVNDEFVTVVDMMKEASGLLADRSDPRAPTQRLQQDILLKLDKLIDQARQNQSQSQQRKPQPQSDQQNHQQQQQQQSSQQQQQQQGESQGGNVPRQDAQLRPPPPGASAAWGDLPPHVRDALMQGFSDRFSSSYERMTEEYYKRLADDRAGPAPARPRPAQTPPAETPK